MKKFALLTLLCLFSCQQGIDIQSEATTSAVRSVTDKEIDFEWVGLTGTFIFKNRCRVSGYVSYYENTDGKITLGIYWTAHFNDWKQLLEGADVPYTCHQTSNPFRNNEIYFASDLVRSRK